MKNVVLLYWLVHGFVCFERPWMALLAFSTLLFSFLVHSKRRAHGRAMANDAEQDSKRPILLATESVNFQGSAALSFLFLLRLSSFLYFLYWILKLVLSMYIEFKESTQHFTAEEASIVSECLNSNST